MVPPIVVGTTDPYDLILLENYLHENEDDNMVDVGPIESSSQMDTTCEDRPLTSGLPQEWGEKARFFDKMQTCCMRFLLRVGSLAHVAVKDLTPLVSTL